MVEVACCNVAIDAPCVLTLLSSEAVRPVRPLMAVAFWLTALSADPTRVVNCAILLFAVLMAVALIPILAFAVDRSVVNWAIWPPCVEVACCSVTIDAPCALTLLSSEAVRPVRFVMAVAFWTMVAPCVPTVVDRLAYWVSSVLMAV